MLVPSFGFQGRRRPKDDPYSSVPKESRDPKGTEEKGSQTAAARLAERVPIPSFVGHPRATAVCVCAV